MYVNKDGPGGCWLYLKGRKQDGYATFATREPRPGGGPGGRGILAHRYAWRLKHGCDPENELDHTCYTRNCVNWDHVVEATREENLEGGNVRRRDERAAYRLVEACIIRAFAAILS